MDGPFKKSCLPAGRSGSSNLIQFQALIAVAIGFSGLIIALLLGYPLNLNIYGLISGVLWAIASAISLIAVVNLGLSIAAPLVSSLIILSAFLWGALVFNELPAGLMLGFLGIGLLIAAVKKVKFEKRAIGFSLASGVIWNIGNLLSLISLSLIGLSKMGPVSQSASLVAVLWGVFYFNETKERRAKIQVLIGALIFISGVIVLGLS